MANTGDKFVFNVQQYLNDTYGNDNRYNKIDEDGYIGWKTIYALTRALQIELGLQSTADNFGDGTKNAFKAKYPHGIFQQDSDDKTEDNIYAIIQGALLCKGYSTGLAKPTKHFYDGTGNAIKKLKSDAGMKDTSSTVTLNIMKSLLSMDYFYTYDTSEKATNIRKMQQYLNYWFEEYMGELTPTDGVYSRRTNKALIYGIQSEEGMGLDTANGNCGPATKRCLPSIPYSGSYVKNGEKQEASIGGLEYEDINILRFTRLANMALYFNGYGSGNYNDHLDFDIIKSFQSKYSLELTSKMDRATWLSLLISCGDTDRKAIACDTATIINNDNVKILVNNGYKYIGRYLSGELANGESKALTTEELKLIFENNLRLFPIHQRSARSSSYFTEANAKEDAKLAVEYADNLKIQFGSIIYFAVDYDATDAQINSLILPYFKTLYNEFKKLAKAKYKIGVYGTRNLCTKVCNAGYAVSSFVSDMSTGFSGNLGFTIPDNWAFDQFANTTISLDGKTIEIDKDGFSGKNLGISQEYSKYDEFFVDFTKSYALVNCSGKSIPVYDDIEFIPPEVAEYGNHYKVSGNKIGEIKIFDLYLFLGNSQPDICTIHRVLFNDGIDIKMGYIEGTNIVLQGNDTNFKQIPEYSVLLPYLKYIPETNSYKIDTSINGEYYRTINKPVDYFDSECKYLGTLEKGDVVVISEEHVRWAGDTMPWTTFVERIILKNGEVKDGGYYVSYGLDYASSGPERAWY